VVNVWWLAIDRNEGYASFEELKHRRVIAQGWPDLGDMSQFIAENKSAHPEIVMNGLDALLRQAYPNAEISPKLLNGLYNFFFAIQPGDLVVGIEGAEVRGICEIPPEVAYSFEPRAADGQEQNYARGRGPVTWFPWKEFSPDWAPVAARRTRAVAGLRGDARGEIIRRFQLGGWQETAHLLNSPKNAERLFRSIRQMDRGEGRSRELIPVKDEAMG